MYTKLWGCQGTKKRRHWQGGGLIYMGVPLSLKECTALPIMGCKQLHGGTAVRRSNNDWTHRLRAFPRINTTLQTVNIIDECLQKSRTCMSHAEPVCVRRLHNKPNYSFLPECRNKRQWAAFCAVYCRVSCANSWVDIYSALGVYFCQSIG